MHYNGIFNQELCCESCGSPIDENTVCCIDCLHKIELDRTNTVRDARAIYRRLKDLLFVLKDYSFKSPSLNDAIKVSQYTINELTEYDTKYY